MRHLIWRMIITADIFQILPITDIRKKYIGSVVDLDALTKISRQLDVSMGSMMKLVNGFAIMIYMVLIYLLSKIIIEKNAQSISMVKILGYTNWRDQQAVYSVYDSIVVVICLLVSFPAERAVMEVLFREMMLVQHLRMDYHVGGSDDLCTDVWGRYGYLCGGCIVGVL